MKLIFQKWVYLRDEQEEKKNKKNKKQTKNQTHTQKSDWFVQCNGSLKITSITMSKMYFLFELVFAVVYSQWMLADIDIRFGF